MSVNKVVLGDKVLLDLTLDTVTPETLAEGVTAHDAAGEAIVGTAKKELLKASEYPAYVSPEVLEVVGKVNSVKQSDSIVFVAMSDSHYPADQTGVWYDTESVESAVQANQAAKALTYMLDVDFFAHLGDVGSGASVTTPTMLKKQIEEYLAFFREAKSDIPVFVCIGNHDSGIYYHNAQTDGAVHTLSGEYIYNNFTALSESDNTVIGGAENGGYCYRDFPEKKLRVIMLNTAEQMIAAQIDNATYGAQRAWLGNALLDLNSKSDAAAWGFVILCHYPVDLGSSTMKISQLLGAYVNGGSITVTDSADGTNQTFNFSGKNTSKFYAHFHGHLHNFLHSKLYHTVSGSPVQYDAWRLCVPNGEYNRENSYGEILGIDWGEDVEYAKTRNTAEGTSFVVNVINPSEQKIYSFCYGAGYDRVVGMGGIVYHSISKDMTLASVTDESAAAVEDGKSYTAKIVADETCTIESVVITMGGVDITSTAYTESTGIISISEVTGTVKITVVAKAPPENLIRKAVAADGVTIYGSDYNGDGVADGYQKGVFLGSATEYTDANYADAYCTGWIPIDDIATTTIVIKNIGTEKVYYTEPRITSYTTPNLNKGVASIKTTGKGTEFVITPDMWTSTVNVNYIRVSGSYMGDDTTVYLQ